MVVISTSIEEGVVVEDKKQWNKGVIVKDE